MSDPGAKAQPATEAVAAVGADAGACSPPLRARLGGDLALAVTVATRAALVLAVGETALALHRYSGAVPLFTKLRLFALAATLALVVWSLLAIGVALVALAPRLGYALWRRPQPRAGWLAPRPPAGATRPEVPRAWALTLGAMLFLWLCQRAALGLAQVLRERQLLAFAIALAALLLAGLAYGIAALLTKPLRRAAARLSRLGIANPLGRWRAAALALSAMLALALAVAWPRSPQLRSVLVVPWWLALALLAGGAAWGLTRRPPPPRSRRARFAIALAALALAVVTATSWGADPRTKYVAVTASPAFDRLLSLVRWATDLDRDGYGSLFGENDCAPFDATVKPFAIDVPDNGRDENCDGHDFSLRDVPAPSGPRPPVPEAFRRPWNVLLLTIDTVRYDRTSFGGYRDGPRRRDTTPRMAELVQRAVSFTHAMAPSAGTMASIPALLTSKFFHSGIALDENVPPRRPPRVKPENLLLPEVMKAAGYRTGVIASHDYWNDWGLQQGVDDYDNSIGAKHDPFLIAADKVTDRSLAWISRQGEGRWFLWAHYIDPHGRYVAHPSVVDWGTSEPDLYDAELRWTDQEVGRLLQELGRLPGGDRTIVIITSDHGDSMGEHNVPVGNHGTALYRELLHVPLIFAIPDNPPKQLGGAVSILDVFPTLVELLGLEVGDATFEGKSLVPQLFYGTPDLERIVFAETNAGTPQRAAISGRHKLIYYLKNNLYEFFDLAADPWEHQNLAPANPPELARYKQALEDWLERVMYARDERFNQALRKVRDILLPGPPTPQLVTSAELPGLRVVGASVERRGAELEVDLFYQVVAPPPDDLTIGLRLGPPAGPIVEMSPRPPGQGAFPTRRWRAGEWIRDRFTLPWTGPGGAVPLWLVSPPDAATELGALGIPEAAP